MCSPHLKEPGVTVPLLEGWVATSVIWNSQQETGHSFRICYQPKGEVGQGTHVSRFEIGLISFREEGGAGATQGEAREEGELLTNLVKGGCYVPDSGAPGCPHCTTPADDMPENLGVIHS